VTVDIAERATIHYKEGTSRVLARPKGSRRFHYVDDPAGAETANYRTRRWLEERPNMDQRCERVEFIKATASTPSERMERG
jgi:hypothetical protein